MAADDEAVDPRNVDLTGKSVEDLREILDNKTEELSKLRAEREQAERDQVAAIEAAQVAQQVKAVEVEIERERQALENQKNIDVAQVATGVVPEPPPEPEAPAPKTKAKKGDEN